MDLKRTGLILPTRVDFSKYRANRQFWQLCLKINKYQQIPWSNITDQDFLGWDGNVLAPQFLMT